MYEIVYLIPLKLEDEYNERLTESGISSFCFEKIDRKLYLKVYSEYPEPLEQIDSAYLADISEVIESDWRNKWAEGYTGHELTDNIYVLPPGILPPKDGYRYILQIDPEDSFGDGHHPTTRLCGILLEHVLETYNSVDKKTYLDIGTGSGVLAIQAYSMGVRDIELFDYDVISVLKADKNLMLNGISGIKAFHDDIYTFSSSKKYNIITANLLSRLIEDNIEKMKSLLEDDGYLIMSGIGSKWEQDMVKLFEISGLHIFLHKKLEEWEGFVLKNIK